MGGFAGKLTSKDRRAVEKRETHQYRSGTCKTTTAVLAEQMLHDRRFRVTGKVYEKRM